MRLLSLFAFLVVTPWCHCQTWIYVAPSGNDSNPGTKELPLSTIAKALTVSESTDGNVTICLREGTYRIEEPQQITPDISRSGKSLTIANYDGEQATISGNRPLALKWQVHKGKIHKAHVADIDSMDALYVDGKLRPMARYPNYDSTAVRFNGTSADATSAERIRSWKNPAGGYLHAMHQHDWGDFHYCITGKDNDSTLSMIGGHQNNRKMGLSPSNRMVENIFEELDAPGEWFFDKNTSLLYYYPFENENIAKCKFETPMTDRLINIIGDSNNPVENLLIKGINFEGTRRTFMKHYEPLLRSDWTVHRGAAIYAEYAANCAIKDCNLYNLGGNALFFSYYNRGNTVSGCHIHDIGASAILFVGNADAVRSPSFEYNEFVALDKMDFEQGPRTSDYPTDCLVYDCLIHDIGLVEKQVTGIELSMCSNITISHNSIYAVPRAGINISEGTWGGHLIENNDIFDTVKETGDHGSINSWGRDRFWRPNYELMCSIAAAHPSLILADAISPNVIRCNRVRCDRGWDIDLDDGSSNYIISENLCLNGGIKLREGFYRTVQNNILVNNTFHPHVWIDNSGDTFTRNIVMNEYQPINVKQWGNQCDYNIFANEADLAAARKLGIDSASISIDLLFVNPKLGDFRLARTDIEAFRIGFHNFPMDGFGVKSEKLRSLARTPAFPTIKGNRGNGMSEQINWLGWAVKNLETEGEQSATGMYAIEGVYVVSKIEGDSPLDDYLLPNDVILRVNGVDIKDTTSLLDAFNGIKGNRMRMDIFRHQKPQSIVVNFNQD